MAADCYDALTDQPAYLLHDPAKPSSAGGSLFRLGIIMPELRFYLSGSLIGTVQADAVPSPGSEVTFVTESYKKGLVPGSVIRFIVEGEYCEPTGYDYSGEEVVARLDVNGYTLVKSGPALDD